MTRQKRVLLVEDDEVWRGIISDYLPVRQFDVATAKTWTGALNEIRREAPDYLVLDLNLGIDTSDGLGLLSMLQDEKKNVKTLVISNTTNRNVVLACSKFEFVKGIVYKPSFFDEIGSFLTFFGLTADTVSVSPQSRHRIREELRRRHQDTYARVLVTHGRDSAAVERIMRLLHELRLMPLRLNDETHGSATIIELFEKSTDVDFAVHILTADDVGRLGTEDNKSLRKRARQNVIFEAGYLFARLGRSRNLILVSQDLELPSDIGGIELIDLSRPDYDVKRELMRSLKEAGISFHF